MMELPKMSGALHTWTHMKTCNIYSPSHYLGRISVNLCVCCYIICKMLQHTCWVAEWFINKPVNSTYHFMKRIIVWPFPGVAPALTSLCSDCRTVSTFTAELFCFGMGFIYDRNFCFTIMGFIYDRKANKWKFADYILKVRYIHWAVCYLLN